MAGKIRYFGFGTLRLLMEIAAVLFGLFVLGTAIFAWRLSSGPLDIGFASDYIEEALYDPETGYRTGIGDVMLQWPGLKGPLVLELERVRLAKAGKTVLTVDAVELGLSGRALFYGRIRPLSISLAAPALRLIRTEDNQITLSIETEAAAEDDPAENILNRIVQTLSDPDKKRSRSPLASLQSIEVADARVIVEDHTLGITWFIRHMDLLLMQDREGLITTISAALPGGRDKAASIQAEAVYFYDKSGMQVQLHLQDFDPRIVAGKVPSLKWLAEQELYINSDLDLRLDPSLALQEARITLMAEGGRIALEGLYEEKLAFQELSIRAGYSRAAGRVEIQELGLLLYDVAIRAKGLVELGDQQARAAITLEVPALPQEKVVALWPGGLERESLEKWLTVNLSKGTIKDVAVNLGLAARKHGEDWQISLEDLTAGFGIAGMTVDYSAPLTPARNVSGTGSYKYKEDVLDIVIAEASVDELDIFKGRVLIDKVAGAGIGTANVDLDLAGPLPAVFKYIADEPIGMTGAELGLDTANIEGSADLSVKVSFPTVRDLLAEQVDVDVAGTLHDIRLPDVVKKLDLTGKALEIKVADGLAGLKGDGLLDGKPVKLDWQQYLESEGKKYSSRITARMNADEGLRTALGIDLSDWISGSMPVDVVYTEYDDERSEAVVNADLRPVTLMVKPFGYEKLPGIEGRAKATARLRNGYLEEISALEVQTPVLNMAKARLVFNTVKGESELRGGDIPRVTLNETDIGLRLEIAPNGQMKVSAKGPFLDARPFLNKGKERNKTPYDGPPLVASVDVERMRTEDARLITQAKAYLEMNHQGLLDRLEVDAVAGRGALYVRLKPDNKGKLVFRLEADDAGETLKAFGVYENVVGGKLVLYGEAVDPAQKRVIYGNAQLSDFRVRDAPVLAQLISAISPTGLPQLLSGEGLSFARLESRFDWHMRPQGDLYVVNDGRTSGSSLGLTFEGEIDKSRRAIDISGHVVPMSEVNSLISSIPLIGDILTGGQGGAVFAATYKISGDTEDPTVFVNPLSVLTPGIIRRILFED